MELEASLPVHNRPPLDPILAGMNLKAAYNYFKGLKK
jgi:hypothetical protein